MAARAFCSIAAARDFSSWVSSRAMPCLQTVRPAARRHRQAVSVADRNLDYKRCRGMRIRIPEKGLAGLSTRPAHDRNRRLRQPVAADHVQGPPGQKLDGQAVDGASELIRLQAAQ